MSLVVRERGDLMDTFRRFLSSQWDEAAGWLRVEELVQDDNLVVRAELPGIDPEKDVDISVVNGALVIRAEKQEKSEEKDNDSYRSEFHYGSFVREIALPAGVEESQIAATYRDGVLEVRVPMGEGIEPAKVKIPISRS
jgi:HSP20 family protein